MNRTFALLAVASLASGCVVVTDDNDTPPAPVEYAPYVSYADAGCYWDDYNYDFIWWFEADVWDDNGQPDISEVWADVYDARGALVQSFQLFRETSDPAYFFSDWLQYSTALDCYYGGYEVDIVAYDRLGYYDAVAVYPHTW
ncbi:MAG: hypothetical protein H6741_29265 [Alphaproteobacteria bacterium]|nr:hypothetical protein [Alphaproteobacteria bacterium]